MIVILRSQISAHIVLHVKILAEVEEVEEVEEWTGVAVEALTEAEVVEIAVDRIEAEVVTRLPVLSEFAPSNVTIVIRRSPIYEHIALSVPMLADRKPL
jgi:hypothetical protein